MTTSTVRTPEVDRYVAKVEPHLREIFEAVRTTVLETAPELREHLKMGVPHYSRHADVIYIADYGHHVNLGFHRGAFLKDPDHVLEGTGKHFRHVKVRDPEDARRRAVRAMIRRAVAFDRG